jgi:osmotically inducible protein OsmC
MAQQRTATTEWTGSLEKGTGVVTGETGALGELPVSWVARSQAAHGKTSPEELIAAAHAACYSMQLSHLLAEAGHEPESIVTTSTVTLDVTAEKPISKIALTVKVKAGGGLDAAKLETIATAAKDSCPVSVALAGVPEMTVESSVGS